MSGPPTPMRDDEASSSHRSQLMSVRLPSHEFDGGMAMQHTSPTDAIASSPPDTPLPPPTSILTARHHSHSHGHASTHSHSAAQHSSSSASWTASAPSPAASATEERRSLVHSHSQIDVRDSAASSSASDGAHDSSLSVSVADGLNGGGGSVPVRSPLLTALAWASLLVAVFSMSAVGPMFLYLAKRGIKPLRAVFWRQTVQCMCTIVPLLLEWYYTPREKRDWWNLRVAQESKVARDKIKADKLKRQQQQQQQSTTAETTTHHEPKQRRRRGGYATTAVLSPDDIDEPQQQQQQQHEVVSGASVAIVDAASVGVSDEYEEEEEEHEGNSSLPTVDTAVAVTESTGRSPWVSLTALSFCWFTSVSLWVLALPYTSAARASLFSSLYPLFVILYLRFWRKVPVSLGEFVGVAVCVAGIGMSEVMATLAPDTHTMAAEEAARKAAKAAAAAAAQIISTNVTSIANGTLPLPLTAAGAVSASNAAFLQFVGDFLCVAGSVFIGYDVVESSACRKVVPLFAYTAFTSLAVWAQLLVATVLYEGSTIDTHPLTGCFGWMSSTDMLVRIIIFGVLVGMVGILGFNFSVAHMSPIVFSTVQLLDPGISGVMSALGGVEGWPVGSTYAGVAMVTAGIFIVVWCQYKREQAAEAEAEAEAEAGMENAKGGTTATQAARSISSSDDPDTLVVERTIELAPVSTVRGRTGRQHVHPTHSIVEGEDEESEATHTARVHTKFVKLHEQHTAHGDAHDTVGVEVSLDTHDEFDDESLHTRNQGRSHRSGGGSRRTNAYASVDLADNSPHSVEHIS